MTVTEAVIQRLLQLCNAQNISITHLCNLSNIAPSTVHSFKRSKKHNIGIETIRKLCDGLEISIAEFFDSELFEDLEQEIK